MNYELLVKNQILGLEQIKEYKKNQSYEKLLLKI